MLQALVRHDGLTDKERTAFEGMFRTVGNGGKLSVSQRDWAKDAFVKYELDANFSANLASNGLAPRGKEVRLPFEDMPRPTKPPGRK
jgi:hypothetical protein